MRQNFAIYDECFSTIIFVFLVQPIEYNAIYLSTEYVDDTRWLWASSKQKVRYVLFNKKRPLSLFIYLSLFYIHIINNKHRNFSEDFHYRRSVGNRFKRRFNNIVDALSRYYYIRYLLTSTHKRFRKSDNFCDFVFAKSFKCFHQSYKHSWCQSD